MNWFRMYHEARNDAKLNSLTDAQFRIWFKLICYAAEQPERGVIRNFCLDLLSIELTSQMTSLEETLTMLKKLRIIVNNENNLTFVNFKKRNYDKPSDYPEEVKKRVTKHRNAMKRPCNAPKRIEQNRTDTDYKDLFARFWDAYPRHKAKQDAEKAWGQIVGADHFDEIITAIEKQILSPEWIKDGGQFIPYPATWLRRHRWEDEEYHPIAGIVSSDEENLMQFEPWEREALQCSKERDEKDVAERIAQRRSGL